MYGTVFRPTQQNVDPVRPLWNPFLVAHSSLGATAVYSKTEVVPLWGGSCPSLDHAHFRPPLACHEGGRARDNGPLNTPAPRAYCVFVHYCALVPAFHKGVITIISTPLALRCPCKITEISHFTRRSIVSVHFVCYLSAFRVFYSSLSRETDCLTSLYHSVVRDAPCLFSLFIEQDPSPE